MKLSQLLNKTKLSAVRGQGMSEYLIIVALIAVAGIAVMGLFGGAARNQVAAMASEIGGNAQSQSILANNRAKDLGSTALNDAAQAVNLTNFAGSNDTLKTPETGTTARRKTQ